MSTDGKKRAQLNNPARHRYAHRFEPQTQSQLRIRRPRPSILSFLWPVTALGGLLLMLSAPATPPPAEVQANLNSISRSQEPQTEAIQLKARDLDLELTSAYRMALARGHVPKRLREMSIGLRQDILHGSRQIARIRLTDWADLDGDIVHVRVDGLNLGSILLSRDVAEIIVPIKTSGSVVEIRGIQDKAGGITLRGRTGSGTPFEARLKVGEVKGWRLLAGG